MKPMVIIARMSIGKFASLVTTYLSFDPIEYLFFFVNSGIALSLLLVSSLSFCFSSRRKAREIS